MFRESSASLAIAGLTVLAAVSETAAGGRALECYEAVHRPALYDTVYEDVVVSPGGQLVDYDPPIYWNARERGADRAAPLRRSRGFDQLAAGAYPAALPELSYVGAQPLLQASDIAISDGFGNAPADRRAEFVAMA